MSYGIPEGGYQLITPPEEPPTCPDHEREIPTPGTDCEICYLEEKIDFYIQEYGDGATASIINYMYEQNIIE